MKKEDFYQRVYEIVALIPKGRVTSYGAIAQALGVTSGARMVGYALNSWLKNDSSNDLPCHRVLNRNGELTGKLHFGTGVMKSLLEREGIEFKDENTVVIQKHFWEPSL